MLLDLFYRFFSWVMLLVIVLNIQQRRYARSYRKRRATLLIAIDFLVVYVLLILRSQFSLPSFTEYLFALLGAAVIVIFRSVMWPFRFHCSKCKERLSFDRILGYDENLCDSCYFEKYPDEKRKIEEKVKTAEEKAEENFLTADKVSDIDWDRWEPTEVCVLTYVRNNNALLMIEKKKGLGAGFINAPGGHIELEETKTEAAVREVKEETGLDVSDLEERAVLRFQFKDGLRLLGYVFITTSFSGTLVEETEETIPFWQDIDSLDFERMWEDDRIWLNRLLKGDKFEAYFIFDEKKMVDYLIKDEE